MTFDPKIITANVAAWFLATRERAKEATKSAKLKRENCKSCVYNCKSYRWKLRDGSCTLTEEMVIAEYPNTDNARRWMALFAVGGVKIGEGRNQCIVYGPANSDVDTNNGKMLLRSLSPPFRVKVDKLRVDGAHEEYGARFNRALDSIAEASQRHQALLFFVLQNMYKHCEINEKRVHGRSRFVKGAEGEKGRRSPNDAMSMSIRVDRADPDWWRIEIWTDTRASYNREDFYPGMRHKPAPIAKSERPRFETGYKMPFFENMMNWTAEPIGTRVRKHLPILENT